jgi:hypothetical protein
MIHIINNCISVTSSKEKDFSKIFPMTGYVKFWTLKGSNRINQNLIYYDCYKLEEPWCTEKYP